MTGGGKFCQCARIHLPDGMAARAESTKPAVAQLVNQDLAEDAARRVPCAKNQNIDGHAGNYIPGKGLGGGSRLNVSGAVVGSLVFRNGLRGVHSLIGNAEQVPELLAVLRHQCNTDAGRTLNFLTLDDVGL